MEPIRILHVVTRMDAAGIETLLMNIYRNIDRTKIQFDFLTHRSDKGFYDDEIIKLGGKIYNVLPINPLNHKNYINSLDNFFNDHKEYKIVHSHINTYSMYPLRSAMKAGIPTRIAHSHIASVPLGLKTPFRIYTKFKLKKYTNYNFACSALAGKWLYGKNSINEKNFKIINNSIDAKKYIYNKEVRNKIRDELGLNDKYVIGHIGRFTDQKNHNFIIDIFKKVYEKNTNAHLLLVGEGKLQDSIKDKVKKLGLIDNVTFTGVRSDIYELLQAMDIFIFPSLFEGLGIVAIESQAAGLHTIVSSAIPKEAFITDYIKPLDLNNSTELWVDEILKYASGYNRRNTYNEIYTKGYDIMSIVEWLEKFYLGEVKN